MALNRKTFPKVTAAAAAENTFASENFNTVLYTGTGSTQRIGGYINRGAVFNGSSSRIQVYDQIDNSDIKAISIWVNAADFSERWPFHQGDGQSTENYIRFYNTDDIQVRWGNQTQTFSGYSANTWYHIVAQTDSNSKANVWINGTEVGTSTTNVLDITVDHLNIGARDNNGTIQYYFKGNIDQLRLFNKTLSTSEIATLYNETHASTTKSTTDIFNDGSGVALYQLDGNANDTGGVSGKYGSAAHFNGSTSEIVVPEDPVQTDITFSISAWINVDNVNTYNHIASVYGSTTATRKYIFRTKNDNSLQFITYDASGNLAGNATSATSQLTIGTWHHVVAVDNSGDLQIYLDGSSVATDTGNSDSNTDATANLNIGRRDDHSGSTNETFAGRIDDVRFYSDVLTSTEVGYIYNNTTASIPTDNLEAHYKFDGDARDETTSPSYDGAASNVTYAYDGTASNLTYQEATKFQSDLIWIKKRSSATNALHMWFDSVRGLDKVIGSDRTNAEYDGGGAGAGYMNSVDSGGFTLTGNAIVNESSQSFVAWCWNAGTDAAASNTDGVTAGSVTAVTSTVKANTAAGFSICTFTTPSSGKPSWGHGLDSAPELIIVKNTGGTGHWQIYAPSLLGQKELRFTTAAATAYSPDFISVDTSKIDLGSTSFNISGSSAHVAYCFHSVDGYSKIGSYTGTGVAGNTVETGFEPAFIMIKKTSNTGSWYMFDNERLTLPYSDQLIANSSAAETTGTYVKFLANGFKLDTTASDLNTSSQTFIYLAIAADPDTTTPTVENSFDVVTYSGTGSAIDVETDFKPDLVWLKRRDGSASSHVINDSVRGANRLLSSDETSAENTAANYLTGFNDNGFTVGTGMSSSSNNYVGWCWKAGDHDDNLPEINTNGSIDSTVSVNDAAGFSIVKYTATNTTATVGHGLSSAPEVVLVKPLDKTGSWGFYTTAVDSSYDYMYLNQTAAKVDSGMSAPTSTIFNVNNTEGMGTNYLTGDYIAYCWYSVSGHSKIGSYTGTGASQSISVGFQPRFVIIKRTNSTGNWEIYDSQRGEHIVIQSDNSNAEYDYSTTGVTDFNTNSFTVAGTAGNHNASGSTYIYMAFK